MTASEILAIAAVIIIVVIAIAIWPKK